MICQQIFSILALVSLLKALLKSAAKSFFFRCGVEIRFWSCTSGCDYVQESSRKLLCVKLHRHRPQIDKVGTDGSQRGNQRLPWQGTAGSQTLKLTVPNLGTRGYHCKELPVPRG